MANRGSDKPRAKPNPIQEAFEKSVSKVAYKYGLPKAYVENQLITEKVEEYIQNYISKATQSRGKDYKLEQDPKFIPELTKYITSGEAFSEQLKKAGSLETTLTQNNPESKSFAQRFKEWFVGKKPEQKYDSSSVAPIDNLAQLFSSDRNYQVLMPEVYSGVQLGAQAKYATNILKVAYGNNLISKEKAQQGMRDSYKIMEKSKEKIGKGIESMLSNLSQIAAGVFGILGILILIMQMQFTGAVVGNDLSISWGAYYGLGLILISLVMFVILKKDLINEPLDKLKKFKPKVKKLKKTKVKLVKQKSLPKKTINKVKKHKKVRRK